MSSLRYISYKFLYDDDRGRQIIKRHRSYLEPNTNTEITPTTNLFRDRVLYTPSKVMGTSVGLRHILSYVGERQLIAKIPYAPGDQLLTDHIEQILSEPQVICGDYRGETLITGGSTNSFSE